MHVHEGTRMDILGHVILIRAAKTSLAWSVELRIDLSIMSKLIRAR